MHSAEIREKARKWHNTPIKKRYPKSQAGLCRQLGIDPVTFRIWRKEWESDGHKPIDIGDLPIEEKVKIFDQLLFDLVQDPKTSAKDRELFMKRYGLLVDKSETKVKFELSAEDLSREFLRARRELEAEGNNQMLTRPALLSQPILLDSGQSQQENGEVEGVASSG